MPEMKLKQQNLLFSIKLTIKSLETKLNIIDRLSSCIGKPMSGVEATKPLNQSNEINFNDIKNEIKKV
jgi:hypothetical protein